MASFNKPSELNLQGGDLVQNFKVFKQEVEIYFTATQTEKTKVEVQVARLLNLVGKDGLRVYNTFEKDENETVESILKKFEQYCEPKRNEVVQHFHFFSRKQGEGEKFDHFITELKHLVKQCNFGEVEDSLLRTQIGNTWYGKQRTLRQTIGGEPRSETSDCNMSSGRDGSQPPKDIAKGDHMCC
ncbi:hypothetical protein M8J77_002053 [Diaphorina citri]|nr:hypothetical protein M8J77_002053 [Diaphorina citri]